MSFSIPFSSGQGEFIPTFTSGINTVSSGASGTILTLTPPAGEQVRLTGLNVLATGTESNISVRVDGVDSVTDKILSGNDAETDNSFLISIGISSGQNSVDAAASIPPIIGRKDEVITVVKTTGSTTNDIKYGYQFGVES